MNNVVSLHQREKTPDDLLTLNEACRKYGYKYGYLYKYSVLEKELTCYGKRGFRAVSESELLEFMERKNAKWRA